MNKLLKIFIMAILLLSPLFAVPADAGKVIKVGVVQRRPLAFIEGKKAAGGLFIDILNEIALKESWSLKYVRSEPGQGLEELKNGHIDLLSYAENSDALTGDFEYNKVEMHFNAGFAYVHESSDIENRKELDGKTLAVVKGDIYAAGMKKMLSEKNITCQYKEYASYDEVLAAIKIRQVDAGVVSGPYCFTNFKKFNHVKMFPAAFCKVTSHFVALKNNKDIIERIDAQLSSLKQEKDSLYYKAYGKWLWPQKKHTPIWLKLSLAALTAFLLLGIYTIARYKKELKKKVEKLSRLDQQLKEETDRRKTAEDILYISKKNL